MEKRYKKLKKLSILLFFLLVAFFLLKEVVFLPGAISGGDWGLPFTSVQIMEYFKGSIFSWTNQGNLLGIRQISLSLLPFQLIVKIFSLAGIDGGIFPKLFLVFLFTFSSFSMYSLLKFLGLKNISSILGGLIYVTTPIFFNYAIMGWQFVLLAMGLFPLATEYFIKAVKENKIKYAIITGIVYSLAMMQSQSLVWFPMIFAMLGFYLIESKKSLWCYLKSISIVFILFVALNMYWALGMILVPDKMVSGSDIVNSVVSLGTTGHFYPLNIIRLFGGLFNFQYETAISNTHFSILSFVIPLMAFSVLFIKKNKKRNITFWLIALIPFGMYILNFDRDILLHIPFSNVIRDFARFTVLSSFSYAVLVGVFLNFLISHKKIIFRGAGYGLIFLWFLSIFPWWTGGLTDWKSGIGSDMRLRNKVFPKEYLEVENNFAKNKLDQKALYLPIGERVSFEDDERFKGMFKETQDIFAGYSPIPGVIGLSDKGHGYVNDFVNVVVENDGVDFIDYLKMTNVGYVILRKNMVFKDRERVMDAIQSALDKKILSEYYSGEKIAVYSVNNFIPHLYIAKNIIVSDKDVSDISDVININQADTTIFLTKQNKEKENTLRAIKEMPVELNSRIENLQYKKINPSKYRVVLKNVKGKLSLVFLESFHDQWKVYAVKNHKTENITNNNFISKNFNGTIQNDNLPKGKFYETWCKEPLSEENHLMANGYANSWVIDVDEVCKVESDKVESFCVKNADGTYDFELVVEFWPQRLFYLGLIISGTTLLGCVGYLIYDWRRRRKLKVHKVKSYQV